MNKTVITFLNASIFVLFLSTMLLASPLDEELQKLKQAGIPTTIEELNLPEIPDSENGALVYKEAFKLIDNLVQKYRKEFEYMPYNGRVSGGWDKTPEEWKKEIADLFPSHPSLSPEDRGDPEEWKKKIIDLILHNPEFAKVYQLLGKASGMKCDFIQKKVLETNLADLISNLADLIFIPSCGLLPVCWPKRQR